MGDIDDKLRKLLGQYGEGFNDLYAGDRTGDYIAKIKQAFADEGYATMKELAELVTKDPVMTGQEWEQRFGKAFKENLDTFVDFADVDMNIYNSGKEAAVTAALEAAKRAAGLDNEVRPS